MLVDVGVCAYLSDVADFQLTGIPVRPNLDTCDDITDRRMLTVCVGHGSATSFKSKPQRCRRRGYVELLSIAHRTVYDRRLLSASVMSEVILTTYIVERGARGKPDHLQSTYMPVVGSQFYV